MELVSSVRSNGKAKMQEEETHKPLRKWCFTVFSVSLAALLVFGVFIFPNTTESESNSSSSLRRVLSASTMLKTVCNATLYSDKCYSTLLSVNSSDPKILFRASLLKAREEHLRIFGYPRKLISSTADESVKVSLKVCDEMIVDALEHLNETIESFDGLEKALTMVEIDEIRSKLSFAIIDHDTCFEGIDEILDSDFSGYQRNLKLIKNLKDSMKDSTEFVSNSLAIVTRILGDHQLPGLEKKSGHRRLLGLQETKLGFPDWLGLGDRRALLDSSDLTPDVTVAKDGSGNFQTINEAVAAAPDKSNSRFLVYIKEGVYTENVFLPKNKWNILMYGDGISKTIVTGRRNTIDDPTLRTFQTATFAVEGNGFMAKDLKFVNTAGPEKHQAVAFRSTSSRSVLYQCAFAGYQDTLYAHRGEQFYRDCDIVGSIDFIFGHAAAVFENCTIRPRQPLRGQYDTVTAHSVSDPYAKSGFSIVRSTISPFDGDNLTAAVYLGRPWKNFSTTVVMRTEIGSLIDPAGWIAWNANGPPKPMIYYGEYKNSGPGSGLGKRVKWADTNMTLEEAQKFTVGEFISGKVWLNNTGVPFDEPL
ncbi:PREDICTED: pectinesterase-like [Tarenaya hassleriana]|uniref:pectinesterase-like n=1 Tax=Tarenaya hassleriana TaxID=28532 RepID=UPI00053CA913|nr:PREDICTED: pectinesterase-like [Tarenaya hassleriana]